MNTYIEICEMSEKDIAGRIRIKMSSHFIHPETGQWNKNGITWLEKYTQDNIKSAIGMNYVVSWADEENQIPSGHGEMSFDSEGNVKFEGVVVGSVLDAYICDVEIDGQIKKVMMTEGYINSQRYSLFVKWLKEEIKNGKVYGSIEINGKGKAKNIVYLDGNKNSDGTLKDGRIPEIFDFSGLAILSSLENPADENSIIFEVNSKQNDLDINKLNDNQTGKEDKTLPENIPNPDNNASIEINEMDINDLATLIQNAFNRKFTIENSDSENDHRYYYIHKFYPTNSTFVMKSYSCTGEYYGSSYTVENSKVLIGNIIKVEEGWKPVDGEQSVEVNNTLIDILNNQTKEESKKMDEKIVLELNQKIEDKINEINTLAKSIEQKDIEINSLTKSLEEKQAEVNSLTEKATGLDSKVVELNTTIVEVNKLLESEKVEKSAMEDEKMKMEEKMKKIEEEKEEEEKEKKKVEVNAYFETEITKNGFEESEVNSLKSFVESVDLEGLIKAEAELCAKKFKEMIAQKDVDSDVEVNTKNDMFISIKQKEKKEVPGSIPSFFN